MFVTSAGNIEFAVVMIVVTSMSPLISTLPVGDNASISDASSSMPITSASFVSLSPWSPRGGLFASIFRALPRFGVVLLLVVFSITTSNIFWCQIVTLITSTDAA